MKKFCSTHSLYYTGVECPCCFNDRIAKYYRFTVKVPDKSIDKGEQEPSEDALNKLMEKFNSKR